MCETCLTLLVFRFLIFIPLPSIVSQLLAGHPCPQLSSEFLTTPHTPLPLPSVYPQIKGFKSHCWSKQHLGIKARIYFVPANMLQMFLCDGLSNLGREAAIEESSQDETQRPSFKDELTAEMERGDNFNLFLT